MRLDKYLKVSRLIKRRPVAKEVSDAGKIELNGRKAKASSEVKPGDRLALRLGARYMEVEILAVAETVRASEAKDLYRIIKQDRLSSENEWDME